MTSSLGRVSGREREGKGEAEMTDLNQIEKEIHSGMLRKREGKSAQGREKERERENREKE